MTRAVPSSPLADRGDPVSVCVRVEPAQRDRGDDGLVRVVDGRGDHADVIRALGLDHASITAASMNRAPAPASLSRGHPDVPVKTR
jgi:hypothetical protein